MKFRNLLLLLTVATGLCAVPTFASEGVKVLVIDSGSDFTHDSLKPLACPNKLELNGKKGVDDDENGYADDVYGWNFVENHANLVNLGDTPPEYDRVIRCMELLGILQAYGKEGMTAEEFKYLTTNYQDQKFWPWVEFTGGWAHGTHCAGTTMTNNQNVRLNAIKHIPTGSSPKQEIAKALSYVNHKLLHSSTRAINPDADAAAKPQMSLDALKVAFIDLGKSYIQKIQEKAEYIGSLKPRLINCSFGSPNSALVGMIKKNMVQSWGFEDPTDTQVQEVVNLFVTHAFLPRDKAMFAKAPNALVFVAAGNSSEDLDPFVSSPNDVPIPNKIVIAATDADEKIAPFSCYGKEKVDVAVPGVNIFATYPNQAMGYMSGTSMACPMAVNYAAQVLGVNPELSPVELKEILMGTVDKKGWLADKVKSGGVINANRAVFAGKLVAEGKSVSAAIKEACEKVPDNVKKSLKKSRPDLSDPIVKELYFSVIK
ncbi:MAG: S8 family serine peptidase [Candidatus Rifleibacteriota bacterium]